MLKVFCAQTDKETGQKLYAPDLSMCVWGCGGKEGYIKTFHNDVITCKYLFLFFCSKYSRPM